MKWVALLLLVMFGHRMKWGALLLLVMFTCVAVLLFMTAYVTESVDLVTAGIAVYTWAVAQFTWASKDD